MTDEKKKLTDILRADGSIIVNKNLARNIGLEAAIMYSEIVSKQYYFADRGQLTPDGFFFNTVENMEKDTTLTDHKQRRAIKLLCALGLIKHRNKDMPQKRYFKVVFNEELIFNMLESQEISQLLKNLRFNSQKIKELILKEFKGNNTNPNNTNPTILSTGSFSSEDKKTSSSKSPLLSFEDFLKAYNVASINCLNESELSEAISFVRYFLDSYRRVFDKDHMSLKPETWVEVLETLFIVEDDYYPGKPIKVERSDLENMADHYFNKQYQEDCNYCITHFNNPGIKKVNYYEAADYE